MNVLQKNYEIISLFSIPEESSREPRRMKTSIFDN